MLETCKCVYYEVIPKQNSAASVWVTYRGVMRSLGQLFKIFNNKIS